MAGEDQGALSPGSEHLALPVTPKSPRTFRESTYLIPSRGQQGPAPPRYEPLQTKKFVYLTLGLLMIALAIGLQVALHFSVKHGGYGVPEKNVFTALSAQFLTSFIPIIFVAPLALYWQSSSWHIRRYQPYINLVRGGLPAEDTVLLDYVGMNIFLIFWNSVRRGHFLVLITSIIALVSLLLQPLAGSVLTVQPAMSTSDSTVTSIRTFGLAPDFFQLSEFLAASGYVQAAVINNLTDPNFINGTWAAADFAFPTDKTLNGSITVQTTGIRTNVNCTAPTAIPTVNTSPTNSSRLIISATSTSACQANVDFDPTSSSQQYGSITVPNCATPPSSFQNITSSNIQQAMFDTVFFWFYHADGADNLAGHAAGGVFCQPFMELFDIEASADLSSGALTGVTTVGSPITSGIAGVGGNISGAPLFGRAFNGLSFSPPNPDQFVIARATATTSGVPAAILRNVTQQGTTALQNAFTSADGFLSTTNFAYTQYLAIVAKSVYFVPTVQTVGAQVSEAKPRLFVEKFPADALTALLLLVGITGLLVQLFHERARRNLQLTAPPGSIGAAVALTSHSGFGEMLWPQDTEAEMLMKLRGLRFRLDERTGAILARDEEGMPVDVGSGKLVGGIGGMGMGEKERGLDGTIMGRMSSLGGNGMDKDADRSNDNDFLDGSER